MADASSQPPDGLKPVAPPRKADAALLGGRTTFPVWLLLVTLVALWMRTHELARRPMHADEANQAVKAGELLESGHYAYDPRDHHGPTLYYAVLPIAWLRGERTLAALTETTVRLVPALLGTVAVPLLAALALPLGRWPALAAALFLALSPPAVYYSRYFVQETLLATFTLGALVCGRLWWKGGYTGWAIATGVCAGLMQATKGSAPLFAAAAALGWLAALPGGPRSRQPGRDVGLAVFTALVTAALFYSSFGANPAGLRDAVGAYGQAEGRFAGATGHEKPWWYYLRLFGWQREGGLLWQQVAFSTLAGAGLVAAVVGRPPSRLLRWAAGYAVALVIAYSAVAYKTPWHAVHFIPAFALLAAGGLMPLGRLRLGRIAAGAVVVLVATSLLAQSTRAAFVRPADPRNPYAYVHSSPDVLKFRRLAEAALARAPDQPVRVIGEEYWPLPWYFRGLPRVGYWSSPPDACDGALVIVSASQADTVRARLHGRYTESFLGLRPGFICVIFTPVQ